MATGEGDRLAHSGPQEPLCELRFRQQNAFVAPSTAVATKSGSWNPQARRPVHRPDANPELLPIEVAAGSLYGTTDCITVIRCPLNRGANMATIALRVEDDVRDQLIALAELHDLTLSDLIRESIDQLLGRDVPKRRGVVPASLTAVQRRSLALQHRTLALLHPEEAEYHERRVVALERGYVAEYGDEFAGIEPEMPFPEAELLWDILDMFTMLEVSIDKLSKSDRAQLGKSSISWLTFGGFDLADDREGDLLIYARFLLSTGRWTNLGAYFDDAHERGHSHHRTLPGYLSLLEVYRPMKAARSGSLRPSDYLLTKEGLVQLAETPVDHKRWS